MDGHVATVPTLQMRFNLYRVMLWHITLYSCNHIRRVGAVQNATPNARNRNKTLHCVITVTRKPRGAFDFEVSFVSKS